MRRSLLKKLRAKLSDSLVYSESAIQVVGQIGRFDQDIILCDMIEILIEQLGASRSPLRSLAYTEVSLQNLTEFGLTCQLLDLARHHNKTPYSLFSPFLERISVVLAANIVQRPDIFAEATSFIGQNRQSFVQTTLQYTLPALVLARDHQALGLIASIMDRRLGEMLVDNMARILTKIFLDPTQTNRSLAFLVKTVQERGVISVSASSLITSCIVPFVVALIIELGDEDPAISNNATTALINAQNIQSRDVMGGDLGVFLKPHMLGVMTHLNEILHDMRGKKTAAFKQKLIRSLGVLIKLVGDSMASYSPQVSKTSMTATDANRSWRVCKVRWEYRSYAKRR